MSDIAAVYDPNDDGVCYWVAWMVEDNHDVASSRPLKFRVFRDERNKTKGEPITDAMSKTEAYEYLRKLKLLIGSKHGS